MGILSAKVKREREREIAVKFRPSIKRILKSIEDMVTGWGREEKEHQQ